MALETIIIDGRGKIRHFSDQSGTQNIQPKESDRSLSPYQIGLNYINAFMREHGGYKLFNTSYKEDSHSGNIQIIYDIIKE